MFSTDGHYQLLFSLVSHTFNKFEKAVNVVVLVDDDDDKPKMGSFWIIIIFEASRVDNLFGR